MKEMRIKVTPVEGRKVRHPDGRELAETGEDIADTAYWRRKEANGDVTISATEAEPVAAPAPAAEAPATGTKRKAKA